MVDREINRITVLKRVVATTEGTESDDKALFFFLEEESVMNTQSFVR